MKLESFIINLLSTLDIYQEILTALEREDRIMLATIISTSGSTPASALSKMIIKNSGTVSLGTIGGGCMEGEVILHSNRLYSPGRAKVLTFNLNDDDIESGLICGGSLDVLIEPISKMDQSLFQELKSLRDEGEDCVLGTILRKDDTIKGKVIFRRSNRELDEWNVEILKKYSKTQLLNYATTQLLHQSISRAYQRNETIRLKHESGEIILEPIIGIPSLIIFGGGHVSKFVSQSAVMAGFHVTIVDDREKYTNPQRFPEAARTLVLDYTNSIDQLTINQSTYIVIVTRGHNYDEIVLEQAVKTPARYIGMIGSKRKVLTTFEHLRKRGITDDQLKNVHAPIGIGIGAVTAEEIAVSIVAELIRARRGGMQPFRHMSESIR